MKILLLTKFSETDEYVLQFAEKINQKEKVEVELLHVVNAYSEVPLKEDGSIIDHCTDIDLTALLRRKHSMEQLCKSWRGQTEIIKDSAVVIGHLEKVMNHKIQNGSYDAIFMGAHPTNFLQDWFSDTTIDRVIHNANIPVLSLKCDRSHEKMIERIGIFNDFEGDAPEEIKAVSVIANAFDAEVHLYKHLHGSTQTELGALEGKMKKFAERNNLKKIKMHILSENRSDEKVMNDQMIKEKLNLIVVPELHRNTLNWLYPKDLKTTLANHLYAPLLIY